MSGKFSAPEGAGKCLPCQFRWKPANLPAPPDHPSPQSVRPPAAPTILLMPPATPARLYFDNAATSFPKPPAVHQAMLRYGTQVGGTAGRGNYREALEGARIIRECRRRLGRLFGVAAADHIIFTLNATDALNLAIKGTVHHRRRTRPGRPIHLVTTDLDHNSVLRPFTGLAAEGVEWTCIPADPQTGRVDPQAIRGALRPETALVAVVHASNVTGVIQPVAEIGAICREAGVPFLVDAAQSAGHIPVNVEDMCIDLLAFPGHKGLLGPLGTGGLCIRPGMEEQLDPLREGGTGSQSEDETQPQTLPDKYEPGSQNAIGIAGLSEAVQWIHDRGGAHWSHERELIAAMFEGLAEVGAVGPNFGRLGLRLLGPHDPAARVGVFSFVHDTLSPHELAGILEQEFGILGRAGLHCAPRAHASLGSAQSGGAFRLSTGPFLTPADVASACRALGEVCREMAPAATE
jgi:cysteine desulfurase / selenocysteine lyase